MSRGRRTQAEAALRPVAGVNDIQVVGALNEEWLRRVGIHTDARSVWLHPDKVAHMQERRGRTHSEFCLEHLPSVIIRPDLIGLEEADARRICLVSLIADHRQHLFVSVKLVRASEAGTLVDELWFSTAYMVGQKSLTRLRKRINFIPCAVTD